MLLPLKIILFFHCSSTAITLMWMMLLAPTLELMATTQVNAGYPTRCAAMHFRSIPEAAALLHLKYASSLFFTETTSSSTEQMSQA